LFLLEAYVDAVFVEAVHRVQKLLICPLIPGGPAMAKTKPAAEVTAEWAIHAVVLAAVDVDG
jgi:hypothetical protein